MSAPFTPERILLLLLFYASLFLIIRCMYRTPLTSAERPTFLLLGAAGAVTALVANYLLYRLGLMSFLPWVNNIMHSFLWIGIGFPYLFFALRGRQPVLVQFLVFVVLSLIVKYAEQLLFGTWEQGNFLHLFRGNFAYILGWATMDGLYPVLIPAGLRLAGKFVPGLVLA
jgi:hypothetical protein